MHLSPGTKKADMLGDVNMLNDEYAHLRKDAKLTIEARYNIMATEYADRVYKDKKMQTRKSIRLNNGEHLPREGWDPDARDLLAGSSLDDELLMEDEVVAKRTGRSPKFERDFALSPFSHAIIFILSDQEALDIPTFRTRHYRSLPDAVIEAGELFDAKGMNHGQRVKSHVYEEFTNNMNPRNVEMAVFAKSPKGKHSVPMFR